MEEVQCGCCGSATGCSAQAMLPRGCRPGGAPAPPGAGAGPGRPYTRPHTRHSMYSDS